MSSDMPTCRITVLKRTVDRDLIEEYLDDEYKDAGPCECFVDGQEFVLERLEQLSAVPDGFCACAWADIRKDIMHVATGGNMPGLKQRGTVITGCTDWFRLVIFKVERVA